MAQDLIVNGGFEQGLDSWTGACPDPRIVCDVVGDTAIGGSSSLRVEFHGEQGDTNFYQIGQLVAVQPETSYLLSYSIKSAERTDSSSVAYSLLTSTEESIDCTGSNWCNQFSGPPQPAGTQGWTAYLTVIHTTWDTAFVRITPRQTGTNTSGTSWWDGISLIELSADKQNTTSIQTNGIRVTVDRDTSGGILSIRDEASGTEFIQSGLVAPLLYRINYKETYQTTAKSVVSNLFASCYEETVSETESEVRLVMTACHADLGLEVHATIVAHKEDDSLRFQIAVTNAGDKIIQSIDYPVLDLTPQIGSSSADDFFLMPYHTGNLYRDLASLPSTGQHYVNSNPGGTSMQLMAYYDRDDTTPGLYIQSEDTQGYFKRFGFERIDSGDDDVLRLFYSNHIAEEQGADFLLHYDIRLQTFWGDWYDAADIYKAWALQQWWTAHTLFERPDIPSFLFDVNVAHTNFWMPIDEWFVINDFMRQQYLTEPYALPQFDGALYVPGGIWGRPDTTWCGVDCFYPYDGVVPLDPLEDDPLLAQVEALHAIDVDAYLWLSGNKWDIVEHDSEGVLLFDDSVDFEALGRDHVIIKEDGSEYLVSDRFCPEGNQRESAMIDIGTADNNVMDEVIVDNIVRGLRRNVRLMSLDQIAGGYTFGNWRLGTDHPIGQGRWLHDRFVELLIGIQDVVAQEGRTGDFALSMEETNEFHIPFLQLHMIRQARNGGFSVRGVEDGFSANVPLFSYVYSRFALAMDEYGFVYGSSTDNPINLWSLATTVLQGNVPNLVVWWDEAWNEGDPVVYAPTFEFFKKLIANVDQSFRGAEILHPPKVSGRPPAVVTPNAGGRTYSINFFHEPLQLQMFRKQDGALALVLISLVDDPEDISLAFTLEDYDSAYTLFDLYENRNGVRRLVAGDIPLHNGYPMTTDMAYKDLVIFEAVPKCPTERADCNTQANDGCEVDTQMDEKHCGACDAACPVASNAIATCAGGNCSLDCAAGWENGNGDWDDGCETALKDGDRGSMVGGCSCGQAGKQSGAVLWLLLGMLLCFVRSARVPLSRWHVCKDDSPTCPERRV